MTIRSLRNANQMLRGERKVSAKAMHVIEGEMLGGRVTFRAAFTSRDLE